MGTSRDHDSRSPRSLTPNTTSGLVVERTGAGLSGCQSNPAWRAVTRPTAPPRVSPPQCPKKRALRRLALGVFGLCLAWQPALIQNVVPSIAAAVLAFQR